MGSGRRGRRKLTSCRVDGVVSGHNDDEVTAAAGGGDERRGGFVSDSVSAAGEAEEWSGVLI